jgi:ribosomal protein S18 acetylase RimI-like enzyme
MPEMTTRPAGPRDIDMVHTELMDVIATSPYYNDRFKAHEMRRLDKSFLRALLAVDPWHIMLLVSDGKPGGAIISGPECGAIFRYWSWVFPSFRQTRLGMHGMRAFDEHFDNGRFHKCFTYVRPENEVALMLLRRYGYSQTCLLKNHIFGQDYVVMEREYTKVSEDYDSGVNIGRLGRLKLKLESVIGL